MSQTSASGSGGAVTPGWYTDPHDPSQLRWWSGEGWTEHVSPAAGQPQSTEQVAAQPVAAAEAAPAQAAQDAPLPSRRTLRDPATEAVESAEAALAAQAAQQQAQQQAAEQQAQALAAQQAAAAQAAAAQAAAAQAAAAQQQAAQRAAYDAQQAPQPVQAPEPAAFPAVQPEAVQPEAVQPEAVQPQAVQPQAAAPSAPVATTPSAPQPTLPVASTSFLEQQGYPPLDGTPAEPTGWGQPAPAAATLPPVETVAPVETPSAVSAVQPVTPAQTLPPVEAPQPNNWAQPVQPEQTLPPVQAAQPNAWNQPLQPTASTPAPQAWGTPSTAAPGLDGLLGAVPTAAPVAEDAQATQWGLAPTDTDQGTRRGAVTTEVVRSSTVWGWLIAISPILAAGAIAYVVLTTTSKLTDWPFEAAVAAPYLLVLLFALADRAALLNLGHSQPRSPAWALATAPVYLIMRAAETRREGGSGNTLTLAWFVAFVIAIGGIVGYGFLTHHALISGLPT